MIDWISAKGIPCDHTGVIRSGQVVSIKTDPIAGDFIEYSTDKRLSVEGSFSTTVQVRSDDEGRTIEISGNPSKFLQGHNIFGSNDLIGLGAAMIRSIIERVPGLTPSPEQLAMIDSGQYRLTRVDVTESWAFQTRQQVRTAILGLSRQAHLTHRGRASVAKESTCYWGKNSRRWSLKAYCKGDEIEAPKHALPLAHMANTDLRESADKLLRVELVLRSLQLGDDPRGLNLAANWRDNVASTVFREYLSKLNISESIMISADLLENLSPRVQLAYQSWKDGHDLRQILPRPTFYRYRTELLKHGIDISIVQDRKKSNVVPFSVGVVLTGEPFQIPAWAYDTPLYFDPSKVKRVA